MCGIAGLVHLDSAAAQPREVRRMLRVVGYRGPDASGVMVDGPAALGHVRLSILDLAGGRQPMHSRDKTLWLTFNGEIFNYVELRETLQQKGHRFATRSDTEVIIHAYEEYGDACVDHFNGQWAFAIWDMRRRRLFVSRDRLGIRPLFYTTAGGKFLFASEVKSLLTDPDVPRRFDPIGLDQTFTLWSTVAPRTVFDGIAELPPGCNLALEDGKVRTWRYWDMNYEIDDSDRSVDDWAEELLDLLTDAARLRLRSDVPVGAYLSGGLDSTVNTALIQRTSDAPLRTFSITFDDAEFDESPYQRAAVDALGTEHQAIRCSTRDIGRVFPEVIWHSERPLLRTAPAPLYLLSELVHDSGYKVVLTGEGADEMLGGYDLFKEAKIRRFWAAQPESTFRWRLLEKLYPYMPKMQANSAAYQRAFFHIRPEDLDSPFFSHLPRWETTGRMKRLCSEAFESAVDGHDVLDDCRALLPGRFDRWRPFCQAQYLETVILLPGYLLASQGDRMAMAHSVEGRFPFLDHRVAELAGRVPPKLKMRGLTEKYLLKRACRDIVPEEVLNRTKQPYRAPDAKCFFDGEAAAPDYVDELLSPERLAREGLFRPEAVQRLVQKARSGKLIGASDNMALVGILSTQILAAKFLHDFPSVEETETQKVEILAPTVEMSSIGPAAGEVVGEI
ncbi:MAG: asparagine synthase (glutamine-hydrolyzing) [Pirellulales bacterium]|nr:asparagine synthase (glutamine-hydrolyzing) [Pirellulales bacterium]